PSLCSSLLLFSHSVASPYLHSFPTRRSSDLGEQLYVSADKTQVEMVLRNLVSNAIKFTPPGGRVFVSAKKEGGRMHISVTDTGRSEEHTSELQSRENLVCRLLLEKKKDN